MDIQLPDHSFKRVIELKNLSVAHQNSSNKIQTSRYNIIT